MKNYLLIILGIIYFGSLIYIKEYVLFYQELIQNIYISNLVSILNGIFAILLSFYSINIFQEKIDILMKNLIKKFKNKYYSLFLNLIIKFINISKYIISIYIGIHFVIIPQKIQYLVDNVFNVSFIVIFLILLTSFINDIFKYLKTKQDIGDISKQVFPIINKVIVIFVWIIGGITIFGNLGYNINALITGAGVGGLAIALAAQKSVANVFGAVSVIINRPFAIGDFVKVGGHMGTVQDIGLTYLTLIDINGHKILIPNENIISSSVENLSKRDNRRVDFNIGLTYNTEVKKVKKAIDIIEKLLKSYSGDTKEDKVSSYRVHFDSFGDFSLNIMGTYFTRLQAIVENNKLKEEINLKIKEQFEKAGIDMAFPTQTIYLEKNN